MADREVVYKVKADTSSFKSDMEGLHSIGLKVFQGIGAAIAGVTAAAGAVSAAIIKIGKDSISAYAEYEQLVGGVDTLFKKSSDKLQAYAREAFKNQQISANQYMSLATSFSASLIQSLGDDTEKAVEYANLAITDMSDNANKMGTSLESIQNAYQGFAKGNFTMLDNLKLGFGGTRSEMERLLAYAEEIQRANGKMVSYSIDKFSDMVAAIHVVQTKMGMTGTTADEAARTIQGSASMMKAAWEDLLAGMASPDADIEELFGNFANSVETFLSNLIPAAERFLPSATKAVGDLLVLLGEKLPGIIEENLPTFLDSVSSLTTTLISGMVKFFSNEDNIQILIKGIGDIIGALAQGVGSPENVQNLLDTAKALITGIGKYITENAGDIFKYLIKLCTSILEWFLDDKNLEDLVEAGGEMLDALGRGMWEALPDLWTLLKIILTKLAGEIRDFFAQPIYDIVYGTYRTSDGSWVNEEAVAKKNQAMDENHYMDYQIVQGLSNPQNLTLEEWQRAQGYDANIKTKSELYAYEYQAALEAKERKTQVNLEMDGFRVASGVMRNIDDAAAYNVDNHFQ